MPSRGLAARHAVTSTTESPNRTMTEPPACLASLPVSKRSVWWPMRISRVVIRRYLLADVQALDQVGVSLHILGLEVVEQPAPAADQHQQAAARMVILGVRLEMIRQVVDAFAQNGDLYFRGTGVCVVRLVTANQLGLAVFAQRHAAVLHERSRTGSGTGLVVSPETLLVEQAQHVTSEQPTDAKRRTHPGAVPRRRDPRPGPATGPTVGASARRHRASRRAKSTLSPGDPTQD